MTWDIDMPIMENIVSVEDDLIKYQWHNMPG